MPDADRTVGVLLIVKGGLMAAVNLDCSHVPDITEAFGERAMAVIEADVPALGTSTIRRSALTPEIPERLIIFGRGTADVRDVHAFLAPIGKEFDIEYHIESVDGDLWEGIAAEAFQRLFGDSQGG